MFPWVSYGTCSALSQLHPRGVPFFHHFHHFTHNNRGSVSQWTPMRKRLRTSSESFSSWTSWNIRSKKMCSQNSIRGCMFLADTDSWSILPHIWGWRVKSLSTCKSLCRKASSSWLLLIIYQSCCWYDCIRFAIVEHNAALFSTCNRRTWAPSLAAFKHNASQLLTSFNRWANRPMLLASVGRQYPLIIFQYFLGSSHKLGNFVGCRAIFNRNWQWTDRVNQYFPDIWVL